MTLLLFVSLSTLATTPLEYVGSELWADFEEVKIDGNYLFAGCAYGVGVFDVSDSLDCFLVEWYYLGDNVSGIELSGDYLFAAAGNTGLVIFDRTDPENLVLIAELGLGDEVVCVDIQGDFAYIGGKTFGLHIVDITSPSAPSLVGSLMVTGGISDIIVEGDYAYLLRGLGGFRIVDISTPGAPSFRGSYTSTTYLRQGEKIGDYVLVAAEIAGVTVLDVSDPDAPTPSGSYPAPSGRSFTSIVVEDNIAYVGAGNYGVLTLDVTIPTTPTLIDHYPVSVTSVLRLDVESGLLYITTPEGLQLADASTTPSDITYVSRADRHSDIEYIWATGTKMLVSSQLYGLDGFNIPEMSTPTHTFHYHGSSRFNGAVYHAQYIYAAAAAEGLGIYRSDGLYDFPSFVTDVAVTGSALDVRLEGSICYVLTNSGVSQVNVLDPTTPSIIEEAVCSDPVAFDTDMEYVYVCDETDGFLVLETLAMTEYGSDPEATGYEYKALAVTENYAYAAAGDDGIIIFDISDPSSPAEVAQIDTDDDAEGIAVANDWLYVAADRDGVIPYRIISPGDSLVQYDAFDTGGRAKCVYAEANYVFIADRYAVLILRNTGVGIAERLHRPEIISISVAPNPFNSTVKISVEQTFLSVQNGGDQTGMSGLPLEIEIFDISGRMVANIPLTGSESAEPSSTNNSGACRWQPNESIGSGIYLVRIKGTNATAKVVYIK